MTRIGIKPESTALEADALTTRPSELFNQIFDVISEESDYEIKNFTMMQKACCGFWLLKLDF